MPGVGRGRAWPVVASAALAVVLTAPGVGSTERATARPLHPALRQLPARMAWAWERPEDLRWLPTTAGVAYLATSVWLEGEGVALRPRGQPLWLREGTVRMPVVHVDASTRTPPLLNATQRKAIVEQLVLAAARSPSQVVQLDFEARLSQRAFLAQVVQQAREALPAEVALSMTALASWCAGDAWMDSLPADEVVPMAFRMSRDGPALRERLSRDGTFLRPRCRDAIGSATDEPLPGLHAPRHYVYTPQPWTAPAWQAHPFAVQPRQTGAPPAAHPPGGHAP